MARPDPERVWLGFAQAAIGGAMAVDVEIDPTGTTWEKVNRQIADDCAAMADEMLERWKLRYDSSEAAQTPPSLDVNGKPVQW